MARACWIPKYVLEATLGRWLLTHVFIAFVSIGAFRPGGQLICLAVARVRVMHVLVRSTRCHASETAVEIGHLIWHHPLALLLRVIHATHAHFAEAEIVARGSCSWAILRLA